MPGRRVATIEAVEAVASVNLLTSDLLEIDSSQVSKPHPQTIGSGLISWPCP